MAVRETSGRGLHAAVEWLLQHLDSLTSLSAALEESRTATAAAADDDSEPVPENEESPRARQDKIKAAVLGLESLGFEHVRHAHTPHRHANTT
jgi:hypothetical protein